MSRRRGDGTREARWARSTLTASGERPSDDDAAGAPHNPQGHPKPTRTAIMGTGSDAKAPAGGATRAVLGTAADAAIGASGFTSVVAVVAVVANGFGWGVIGG